MNEKWILVDTTPKKFKRGKIINPGLQIVSRQLNASIIHWTEIVDISQYTHVGFNIYYPLHILNVYKFLTNHGISSKIHRHVKVVAGGQGVSNLCGIETELFDHVFKGEFDYDMKDKKGFHRAKRITTLPIIEETDFSAVKTKNTIIETTRGCRYNCAFCEYTHVLGGHYREKSIELVKEQIDEAIRENAKNINFLSTNIAGYSKVDELVEHCLKHDVNVLNRESCVVDIKNIEPFMKKMSRISLGIESFDERTRIQNGKNISDADLLNVLEWIRQRVGYIFIYLIYGLPDDNYDNWFPILKEIGKMLENPKPLKIDFGFTPFEPCIGTPHEGKSWVNYEEYKEFKTMWMNALSEYGILKKTYADLKHSPPEFQSKFGKGETRYRILMTLKTSGAEAYRAMINRFKNGTSASPGGIKSNWRNFLIDVGKK